MTPLEPTAPAKIYKIVLTGGPGAGKTTAIARMQETFQKYGMATIVVPETATELINAGIAPWTCQSMFEFQHNLFRLQTAKEDIYEQCAQINKNPQVVLILDRGLLDNKAYLPEKEFEDILTSENTTEKDILSRYDAVFHLVTAANGARDDYTLDNNHTRTETPDQAVCLDDRLKSCWKDHPYLRTIAATPIFEEKLEHLQKEIETFLQTKGVHSISCKPETSKEDRSH